MSGFVHLKNVGAPRIAVGELAKEEIAEADDHREMILEVVYEIVSDGTERIGFCHRSYSSCPQCSAAQSAHGENPLAAAALTRLEATQYAPVFVSGRIPVGTRHMRAS